MRKAVVLAVAIVLASNVAWAFDDFEFNLSLDYYGKYVWRGQLLNDDPVIQTDLSVTYKGLTLGAWGNMDTTDYANNQQEFTEWDYYLDYSGNFGDSIVGYSVGIINYHFPSVVGDTTEIYGGLSFDVFLNPTITLYYDIDEKDGLYASFGISHTIENVLQLTDSISANLDLSASVGWGNSKYNQGYWGVNDVRANDLALSAALPIDIGKGWSITPSLNYVTIIDGGLRATDSYHRTSDYFFAGINISKSF